MDYSVITMVPKVIIWETLSTYNIYILACILHWPVLHTLLVSCTFQLSRYYALSIRIIFVFILCYLKYIVWNYNSWILRLFDVVSFTLTIFIYSFLYIFSSLWFWLRFFDALPKFFHCYYGTENHHVVCFMC